MPEEDVLKTYRDNFKTSYLMVEYDRLAGEIVKNIKLAEEDETMKEMAMEEVGELEKQQAALLARADQILAEDKVAEAEVLDLIMEFRAGAGGEESAIFAQDLAMMYEAYCRANNWSFNLADQSESEMGI